jgi:nucleotide-binding universal stress UspA family protein
MKILVAIDGSKSALQAVKYVRALAGQLAHPPHITLLTVHDDTGLRHLTKHLPKGGLDDYFREISERDLKPARKLLDNAEIAHDMVIHYGHVVDEILKTADSGKFDLIVLGSKGRSGLSDLMIGSVAQRISALSRRPVTLVK